MLRLVAMIGDAVSANRPVVPAKVIELWAQCKNNNQVQEVPCADTFEACVDEVGCAGLGNDCDDVLGGQCPRRLGKVKGRGTYIFVCVGGGGSYFHNLP